LPCGQTKKGRRGNRHKGNSTGEMREGNAAVYLTEKKKEILHCFLSEEKTERMVFAPSGGTSNPPERNVLTTPRDWFTIL